MNDLHTYELYLRTKQVQFYKYESNLLIYVSYPTNCINRDHYNLRGKSHFDEFLIFLILTNPELRISDLRTSRRKKIVPFQFFLQIINEHEKFDTFPSPHFAPLGTKPGST